MSRAINCSNCKKDMGEIRDARLRKGIVYLCDGCHSFMQDCVKRLAAKTDKDHYGQGAGDFGDVFGDVFGDIFKGK